MILGKEAAFRFFRLLLFPPNKNRETWSKEDITIQEAAGKDGCLVIALS